MTLLSEGETYILWFTLRYRDEILHEQLFPVIAGGEGGDPNWISELIGEEAGDVSNLANSGSNNMEGEEENEGQGGGPEVTSLPSE